ncbi:MAG: polysulfide reductase NrfD [bacterium]|nr:polysulfide reductase NrfD [bacterium]
MLEKALKGSPRYWTWISVLVLIIAAGFFAYWRQLNHGLEITGLNRDVTWGLYIAQFTFMVGVAASAVMVVLPYYLHNYKPFGRMVILGECLAISAVIMCMLFIFVDMGQPSRVINVIRFPSPNSLMFWDMMSLMGYLGLNVLISLVVFTSERNQVAPPHWIKPVIILSIPWAVSIHTVTAFLYSGLEARSFWLTAILVPRFLASAFASGPSLLIILSLLLRKFTKFDPGEEALKKLSLIVTYALSVNIFFVAVELFTGLYSDIPEHVHHFQYLFVGLEGKSGLAPAMWLSVSLSLLSLVLLYFPRLRENHKVLPFICGAIIVAVWIEKGLGLVVAGFIPNPLGHVTEYFPSSWETMVTIGVYGIGFLILTGLWKIALTVREEIDAL